MSVLAQVDFTAFQRVAEKLLETDKRTFPQFVNGQLWALGRAAIQHTRKANRQAIAAIMGVKSTGHVLRGKTGARGWVRSNRKKYNFAKKNAAP